MAKIIYKKLCYQLNGIFYEIYNTMGNIYSEKQYQDALETKLKKRKIEIRERKRFAFCS